MKITNNSTAPQGVHTTSGVAYIAAGQTKDLDVTDAGHVLAKRLSFLAIDGSPVKAPARADAAVSAPKAKAPKKPADPELVAARADYKGKFGKNAGPKWTVAQIREKLSAE